jgi:hypothetical protein
MPPTLLKSSLSQPAVEPPPLFVKQRFPVYRHPPGGSGHRLVKRMRVRSGQLRTGEEFLCTVIVKPVLAGLEACDNWMACCCAMLRSMLIWRGIAAADVATFGASAKMQPPCASCQAFNATGSARFDCCVDTVPLGLHMLSPTSPALFRLCDPKHHHCASDFGGRPDRRRHARSNGYFLPGSDQGAALGARG